MADYLTDAAERSVLVQVVKNLLAERCAPHNHYFRKCVFHAAHGNLTYVRANLNKAGINPKHLDAILPLIRG